MQDKQKIPLKEGYKVVVACLCQEFESHTQESSFPKVNWSDEK